MLTGFLIQSLFRGRFGFVGGLLLLGFVIEGLGWFRRFVIDVQGGIRTDQRLNLSDEGTGIQFIVTTLFIYRSTDQAFTLQHRQQERRVILGFAAKQGLQGERGEVTTGLGQHLIYRCSMATIPG